MNNYFKELLAAEKKLFKFSLSNLWYIKKQKTNMHSIIAVSGTETDIIPNETGNTLSETDCIP